MSLFRRGAGLLHLWGAHPPLHSSFRYCLTSQQVRTSFLPELSLCSSRYSLTSWQVRILFPPELKHCEYSSELRKVFQDSRTVQQRETANAYPHLASPFLPLNFWLHLTLNLQREPLSLLISVMQDGAAVTKLPGSDAHLYHSWDIKNPWTRVLWPLQGCRKRQWLIQSGDRDFWSATITAQLAREWYFKPAKTVLNLAEIRKYVTTYK